MVKIWAKAMENKKIKRAYVFEREGAVRYADTSFITQSTAS